MQFSWFAFLILRHFFEHFFLSLVWIIPDSSRTFPFRLTLGSRVPVMVLKEKTKSELLQWNKKFRKMGSLRASTFVFATALMCAVFHLSNGKLSSFLFLINRLILRLTPMFRLMQKKLFRTARDLWQGHGYRFLLHRVSNRSVVIQKKPVCAVTVHEELSACVKGFVYARNSHRFSVESGT